MKRLSDQEPPDSPDLSNLNIRQLQVYGAVCLSRFCRRLGITDSSVSDLVSYLWKIAIADDLPEWDRSAVDRGIVGRYVDLPSTLLETVPTEAREAFVSLIENCSEIGWVDMYGADTSAPLEHTQQCVDLLHRFAIEIPETRPLASLEGTGHWGQPKSVECLRSVLQAYGETY